MSSYKRRSPCGNCPFRKDAPLAHWHPSEYQKLSDMEKREGELSAKGFHCHKDNKLPEPDREYCVGWLINQRERGVPSMSLRIAMAMRDDRDAIFEQLAESRSGVPLYASVGELVRANIEADMVMNPCRYPPRRSAGPEDPRRMVCFAKSFAYEGADNVSHATLDGERTLCGRTDWVTKDPWHKHGPDCLRCASALKKREASGPSNPSE